MEIERGMRSARVDFCCFFYHGRVWGDWQPCLIKRKASNRYRSRLSGNNFSDPLSVSGIPSVLIVGLRPSIVTVSLDSFSKVSGNQSVSDGGATDLLG